VLRVDECNYDKSDSPSESVYQVVSSRVSLKLLMGNSLHTEPFRFLKTRGTRKRVAPYLPNEGRKLKGLTSKEHLFLRVLSVVALIDGVGFFLLSRHPEYLSSPWKFARFAVLLTALTLFVLSVNLWFWWKYLRRTDNQRFWVWDFSTILEDSRKTERTRTRLTSGGKARLKMGVLITILSVAIASVVTYATGRGIIFAVEVALLAIGVFNLLAVIVVLLRGLPRT
jgi:hypothetical protein